MYIQLTVKTDGPRLKCFHISLPQKFQSIFLLQGDQQARDDGRDKELHAEPLEQELEAVEPQSMGGLSLKPGITCDEVADKAALAAVGMEGLISLMLWREAVESLGDW